GGSRVAARYQSGYSSAARRCAGAQDRPGLAPRHWASQRVSPAGEGTRRTLEGKKPRHTAPPRRSGRGHCEEAGPPLKRDPEVCATGAKPVSALMSRATEAATDGTKASKRRTMAARTMSVSLGE